MRPHRYLQVPDSACTWPMHPTTAPWGEGPHQLRYKYHTQNRDTYEPRTDTHRPHTGLRDCSYVDSAPRYRRAPDSVYARSMRRPPPTLQGRRSASAVTLLVPHRTDTCAHAKTKRLRTGLRGRNPVDSAPARDAHVPTGPHPSHRIHDGAAMGMAAAIVASGARTRHRANEPCSVPVYLPVLSEPVFGGVALLRQ